mgnify:CR=1 FL=1
MKITDLLTKESIDLNVKASNKKDVIEQAVELMEQNGNINNKEEISNKKRRRRFNRCWRRNSNTTWKRGSYFRTRACSNGNTRWS